MNQSTSNSDLPDKSIEIQALIEGELSEEEFNELQESLKSSPELLDQYLAAVRTDHLLREKHQSEDGGAIVQFHSSRPDRLGIGIGLAAAVAIALVVFQPFRESTPVGEPSLAGETMPEFEFAPGAVFEATRTHADSLGDQIHEGELVAMREGYVSITLPSGTEAVIQSPSSFSITGDNRLKLDHGEGWFRVPEGAEGFAVDLPWLEVVDLGTVFTVSADESVNRVEVEEGRVETRDRESNEAHTLSADQSLSRYHDGSVSVETVSENLTSNQSAPAKPVFYENLSYVPDQDFAQRVPLTGRWEIETGNPEIAGGKFVAGETDDEETLVYGRFTEVMEPDSDDVLLLSFRAKAPENFFHSKGFAGVSLFNGEREVFFFGDMSNNSYSWGVVDYGEKYTKFDRKQPTYDLPIQGSEESFTLRYRAKTGELEIFRGWGVKGAPVLKIQSDPGLGFDRVRVASGKGGDFSFDVLKVAILR